MCELTVRRSTGTLVCPRISVYLSRHPSGAEHSKNSFMEYFERLSNVLLCQEHG